MFWDPVMRFCWKRVGEGDAEDLAQEVFTGAYRAVRAGGGPSATDKEGWRRYLLSCARNRVIDFWRRGAMRPPVQCLEGFIGDEIAEQKGIHARDARAAGAAAVLSEEQRLAIRACMNGLDIPSRAACWLLFVENRSKREIGRMMDKPESSVRVLLADAIKLLRECLHRKGVSIAR